MKKLRLILSVVVLFVTANGFAQDVLVGYQKQAADNNPTLKAKFNEYYAALEKVNQVGSLPDPTVSFGYFINPIETKNGPQQAKFSVNQMFPWFGTLNVLENSAESMAKAKYELFEEAKSKLFYDVKSTYYNLYFTKKAIAITEENLKILNTFLNLANIKIESGSASSVDSYRVTMEINELENQLALLRDNYWTLQVAFNNQLNIDSKSQVIVVEQLPQVIIGDKQSIMDSIVAGNNKLSSYDYQIESYQHKQKAAQKAGMPKISIGLEYALIGDNGTGGSSGQDAFIFPQVGIVIPLYRKKYDALVQEVVFMQQVKVDEKVAETNKLEVLFEKAWKDFQDANRRIELYIEQTSLASKSLEILQSQYATNSSNFEEILRMERKLLKYSLELQKAQSDRAVAKAFIQYLQGL